MPDLTGMRVHAPSKIAEDIWSGAYDPGERFSKPQLFWLDQFQINHATVEAIEVRAGVSTFLCPIIRRSGRGDRVQIITVGGDRMWVDA